MSFAKGAERPTAAPSPCAAIRLRLAHGSRTCHRRYHHAWQRQHGRQHSCYHFEPYRSLAPQGMGAHTGLEVRSCGLRTGGTHTCESSRPIRP
eukprot:4017111-Prymnesium_polylepis.1